MAVFKAICEPVGLLLGFVKGMVSHTKSVLLTMLGCSLITACSGVPIVSASENFNSRVNHLVVHFTSEDFERSLAILTGETERRVGALPYPRASDVTYSNDNLRVYELVSTSNRAGTQKILLGG